MRIGGEHNAESLIEGLIDMVSYLVNIAHDAEKDVHSYMEVLIFVQTKLYKLGKPVLS